MRSGGTVLVMAIRRTEAGSLPASSAAPAIRRRTAARRSAIRPAVVIALCSVTPHDCALSLSDRKPGRGHPKPLRRGGLPKPVVIGEQDTEIGAEGERRSEVDGVERAELRRFEVSGPVEQWFVDAHQPH